MKSILIIGMGRFGKHLCRKFMALGNEVMIVDRNEAVISELASEVTGAQIADCTDESVLRQLGVHNFDLCVVCIGSDFAASLLITSMLHDLGARYIVAKAGQDVHARLLLRNGANEVAYPERDSAERTAARLSAQNVFDYIELTDGYSIYEIPPLPAWVGRSVREIDVRNKHRINILAVKDDSGLRPMPGADYRFTGHEHILALAAAQDARKLLKKIDD